MRFYLFSRKNGFPGPIQIDKERLDAYARRKSRLDTAFYRTHINPETGKRIPNTELQPWYQDQLARLRREYSDILD